MALVVADRVKETTTTTGTGTVTLLGASTGFQSFAAVGDGNTTYYTIAGQTGSEWEVGIGTYTSSGTTLSRTTVLSSSNGGSLVNFSAGTKDVFVTYPSSRSVYVNGTTITPTNSGILPVASGGTGLTAGTSGGIPYYSSTSALASSALLTQYGVVYGGGAGATPVATAAGTTGQVLTATTGGAPSWAAAAGGFSSGTLMLFVQTAAPTGWTKSTTHNDKALRVVSGTVTPGGTTAFSTVFANQTPTITTSGLSAGATTLSTAQMPSHTHSTNIGANTCGSNPSYSGLGPGGGGIATSATGGGGSHTHPVSGSATSTAITLNVAYVDVIIATKD